MGFGDGWIMEWMDFASPFSPIPHKCSLQRNPSFFTEAGGMLCDWKRGEKTEEWLEWITGRVENRLLEAADTFLSKP